MITVRRAVPEDREAVFAFSKLAYPDRWQYKVPERWQWEYVDNPFLPDDRLPVWIAVDEDEHKVIGQTCAMVEPLKLGDVITRVGWSVDTFLLPTYRGQGIGFQLQKANDEGNPVFMSLSMSGANRRIKAGLGSVPLEPVMSYTRLARFTPDSMRAAAVHRLAKGRTRLSRLISAAMRVTMVDRLSAGLLNLGLDNRSARQLGRPSDPSAGGLRFEPVSSFGAEIDRLWDELSPNYYAAVTRTSQYLNWKYVQQPFVKYTRLLALRGDTVCGYLIYRVGQPPERRVGILADFLIDPRDTAGLRALLAEGVRRLHADGAKDISAASTLSVYQKALVSLGFHPVKEVFAMFHCKPGPADELSGVNCEQAVEPGSWLLGRGDHDWDQYPLAK